MPENLMGMTAKNAFAYSDSNKRYHTYDWELRHMFGQKVSRISLDAGFTCPNIDGTRGRGGCTYCGGHDAQSGALSEQFEKAAQAMRQKWDTPLHIAYLQAHTNTYGDVDTLSRVYDEALSCKGVVGLSIATRPDCLPEDVCELLERVNKRTYLVVELGLQTIHEHTAQRINRRCGYDEFLAGYERLKQRGIRVGVHLINGLPGESAGDMIETASSVGKLEPYMIKLHMLYITRGTRMAEEYERDKFHVLTREEYAEIVCGQLERIPAECVIGRVTGDGQKSSLIAPLWSLDKLVVMNEIDKLMAKRGTWQGARL